MEKHFSGDHISIFYDFKTHISLGIFCVRYNCIGGLILLLTIYSSLALLNLMPQLFLAAEVIFANLCNRQNEFPHEYQIISRFLVVVDVI